MGGSSKQTIGYWYRYCIQFGIGFGPVDAFLEFRGGDRTAWKGRITSNQTLAINKPNLWGGEKDGEGGIVGDLEVRFGHADQAPSSILTSIFGAFQSAHRAKFTAVFLGKYGARNPYPKPCSFKFERILEGWDNDVCWYPERAVITEAANFAYDQSGWRYRVTDPGSEEDFSGTSYDDRTWMQGAGGFGSGGPGGALGVGTFIPAGDIGKGIWIRRNVGAVKGQSVRIDVWHDDGAWLFWNGEPVEIVATEDYYHGVAVIPGAKVVSANVVALKVLDSIPGGSPSNIYAALDISQSGGPTRAMNPAHILYDSITSRPETGGQGEPIAAINDAHWRAQADTLYAEGFGLCTYPKPGETAEDFQQRICNVIGARVSQSRVDGLYYLDLIRGNYDFDSLPILHEDDILEFSKEPSDLREAVNQVLVEWSDPVAKEDRTTAPIQSLGAIQSAGGIISETHSFREIPFESLAIRAGKRELDAKAKPLTRFNKVTNRVAYALRPGLYYRLQCPSEGIGDMVCLAGDIEDGELVNGRIRIVAIQDVFAMPDTVYVGEEPGLDIPVNQVAIASPHQRAIELPYIELAQAMPAAQLSALADDVGFLGTMASQPNSVSLNYRIATAAGSEVLVDRGAGDWCPTALVVEDAVPAEENFTLTDAEFLGRVVVGSWAMWEDEICRVDAIDAEGLTVSLGRGCADTVPALLHEARSRIYFCGDWVSSDQREYVGGESVHTKLLTRTASDLLSEFGAPLLTVDMDDRAARPYPPGNLKVGGDYAPTAPVIGPIELTLSHRDRVLQADQVITWTAVSIGPEPGVAYQARYYDDADDNVVYEPPTFTADNAAHEFEFTGSVRLEVHAVRDGLESWQPAVVRFLYENAPAELILTEDGEGFITEDGEPVTTEE